MENRNDKYVSKCKVSGGKWIPTLIIRKLSECEIKYISRQKSIPGKKEGYFIKNKCSTFQEDMTILNVCTPNNKNSNVGSKRWQNKKQTNSGWGCTIPHRVTRGSGQGCQSVAIRDKVVKQTNPLTTCGTENPKAVLFKGTETIGWINHVLG